MCRLLTRTDVLICPGTLNGTTFFYMTGLEKQDRLRTTMFVRRLARGESGALQPLSL